MWLYSGDGRLKQTKGREKSQKKASQGKNSGKNAGKNSPRSQVKNFGKSSPVRGRAKNSGEKGLVRDQVKKPEKKSPMRDQAKKLEKKSQGKSKTKKLAIPNPMQDKTETVKINKNSTSWDTIIVGAGAAGMAAAIASAKREQTILLLDRQNQMGRKILVTGNGKCNLTNFAQKAGYYRSNCSERVQRVLSVFGQKEAMGLFQSLGIYTKDKKGYVYPYSEQATSVREAFETEILADPYITFIPFSEVYDVQKKGDLFCVKVREQSEQGAYDGERMYYCRSVLITTGGLAGPKFGCDGSGYTFARIFGHEIIKPLPALTALKSSAPFLKKVSGVRNQAAITLEIDGKFVKRETGELQWTDYGISGVAIFQLSRFAVTALEEKKEVVLYFDFMPELSSKEKLQQLLQLARNHEDRELLSLVKGLFPVKLCPVILREAGLNESILIGRLQEQDWETIVTVISHFPLRINGYMGFEKAQVTRGGVSLSELTDDLESNIQPGLFFAGEVTDVDGTCGGYNLQWAFSSGTVAGRAILKRNQKFLEQNESKMAGIGTQ